VTQTLEEPIRWSVTRIIDVQRGAIPDAGAHLHNTLSAAVAEWNALPAGTEAAIVLLDSQTLDLTGLPVILIPEGSRLLLIAGTWADEVAPGTPDYAARTLDSLRAEGVRPHLLGDLRFRGTAALSSVNPGEAALNGLLIEGSLIVEDGNLVRLRVDHSTIVPPTYGVAVEAGNPELTLRLHRSISGAISLPTPIRALETADSIIHAPPTEDAQFGAAISAASGGSGTPADFQTSTIWGDVSVYSLQAGSSIFFGAVTAVRRQIGCVRFSYITSARTPRRYRCQPDLALAKEQGLASVDDLTDADVNAVRARLVPSFTSRQYGHPAYAQLSLACADEVRMGAEDGAEMGAFSFLKAPQREANLRIALEEYLNVGLEAGIFYVT
jgi:hypothetical protein